MGHNKSVILIPYWIREALGRNNLPLSACFDSEKIGNVISLNDYASFIALNDRADFFELIFGRVSSKDVAVYGNDLNEIVNDIKNRSNKKEIFKFYDTAYIYAADQSVKNMLLERLFSNIGNVSSLDKYEDAFEIYNLEHDSVGVVINPGHFINGNNIELQLTLVEAVLEALLVYQSFHTVAKSVFFSRYLEVLSRRK